LANIAHSLSAVPNLQSLTENLIKISNKFSFDLVTSIAAAGLIVLGSAAAAQADDAGAALTKVVSYGDLNLDSTDGARALLNRLHGAANTVCAPFEARSLDQKRRWQTCYDQAIASAVTHIDSVKLTAAAHGKIADSKPVG
jgi:UrcA family protein